MSMIAEFIPGTKRHKAIPKVVWTNKFDRLPETIINLSRPKEHDLKTQKTFLIPIAIWTCNFFVGIETLNKAKGYYIIVKQNIN
ncbi:MAG: hypothetical protein JXR61_01960 [Prolixibacteraceae bacterium]|nr:hypothetical protein [Prolixibacteraceae bacterium]